MGPSEERERIRQGNMEYLMLTPEQYDRHHALMEQKMTEWPADLWEYVREVGNKYGMCGEVISSSIADYIRGTPAMTSEPPPTMKVEPYG